MLGEELNGKEIPVPLTAAERAAMTALKRLRPSSGSSSRITSPKSAASSKATTPKSKAPQQVESTTRSPKNSTSTEKKKRTSSPKAETTDKDSVETATVEPNRGAPPVVTNSTTSTAKTES